MCKISLHKLGRPLTNEPLSPTREVLTNVFPNADGWARCVSLRGCGPRSYFKNRRSSSWSAVGGKHFWLAAAKKRSLYVARWPTGQQKASIVCRARRVIKTVVDVRGVMQMMAFYRMKYTTTNVMVTTIQYPRNALQEINDSSFIMDTLPQWLGALKASMHGLNSRQYRKF